MREALLLFFVSANISFRAVDNPHLHELLAYSHGPKVSLPSRRVLSSSILASVAAKSALRSEEMFSDVLLSSGCTVASDGWSTRTSIGFINFMLVSAFKERFHSCQFGSSYKKASSIADETIKVIEDVGPERVVQVCMDGASKAAFKIIMKKYPKVFYTWCSAHSLDLMLEDFCKVTEIAATIQQTRDLITLIMNHGALLHQLRQRSPKILLRPALTRFATHFIAIERVYECRDALSSILIGPEFDSFLASLPSVDKRDAADALRLACGTPTFFQSIHNVITLLKPIVVLLRMVDGVAPGLAGKIWYHMFVLQELLSQDGPGSLLHKFTSSTRIFVRQAFANRWNKMHSPIFTVGFLLDPEFRDVRKYGQLGMVDFMNEWHTTISRMYPGEEDTIAEELSCYLDGRGSFSRAVPESVLKNARLFWQQHGSSAPRLQSLAIRVFSQPVSASSCERNWSIFSWFLSARRNRLDPQTLNNMVIVQMNDLLARRADNTESDLIPWITESIDVLPGDPNEVLFNVEVQEEDVEDDSGEP
jgi:hypothetical protein